MMTAGSRSVNPRSVAGRYKMTLNGREDLNSSMSLNGGPSRPTHLFKSASVSSLNVSGGAGQTATATASNDEKLQRSQQNIDKKMREDFDRI